jgi:hypothetical protein
MQRNRRKEWKKKRRGVEVVKVVRSEGQTEKKNSNGF